MGSVDFDVAARLVVLILVGLVGGLFALFGAGARLVTALSIAAIAIAPLIYICFHVGWRPPRSAPSNEHGRTAFAD